MLIVRDDYLSRGGEEGLDIGVVAPCVNFRQLGKTLIDPHLATSHFLAPVFIGENERVSLVFDARSEGFQGFFSPRNRSKREREEALSFAFKSEANLLGSVDGVDFERGVASFQSCWLTRATFLIDEEMIKAFFCSEDNEEAIFSGSI